MSLSQAMPWIKESRLLSKDELAIAIMGHHRVDTSLPVQQCNLPCVDANGRPVILASTLLQLGEKCIRPVSNTHQVDEQKCTTMALTLWRDEWTDAEWHKAVDHSFAFVKSMLQTHNLVHVVESMWGRSVRGDHNG